MKSTPPSVSLKKDINYFHRKQFFKRETRKSKSKFRENIHPSFLRWLYPYGWILCNFYFLEIFFGWKGQKITLLMVNSLKFWFLFWWLGFFYLEFCVSVVLTLIARFLLGDLLTFFTLQACIFTIFTFFGFFGMKMDNKFFCNGECYKILIFI